MESTDMAPIKEESRQLDHMRNSRLDDSLFSKELAPHYMKLAGQLAASDLVPKSFRGKPQDLFICWAMGYQIGLTPEQSMQCIAVINGKPAMWGDDMLALCMAHKDFIDISEAPIFKGDAIVGYTCVVSRRGMTDKSNRFTLDDAKKAGLLAKGGVWTQYPERMLKLRARGFTLRDAFPDALKGIKPREEVEDYIEAEYKVSDTSGTRTERLKSEIARRHSDVEETKEEMANVENSEVRREINDCESEKPLENPVQATLLHLKIRRLIDEIGFTEERIAKALAYYEADSIESLGWEAAHNFYHKLEKL